MEITTKYKGSLEVILALGYQGGTFPALRAEVPYNDKGGPPPLALQRPPLPSAAFGTPQWLAGYVGAALKCKPSSKCG